MNTSITTTQGDYRIIDNIYTPTVTTVEGCWPRPTDYFYIPYTPTYYYLPVDYKQVAAEVVRQLKEEGLVVNAAAKKKKKKKPTC